MGTLGRQESPYIKETGKQSTIFLMTEVNEELMRSYPHIYLSSDCMPRLSIDWCNEFITPLLNPYKASVAYKNIELNYLMYNYSYEGGI